MKAAHILVVVCYGISFLCIVVEDFPMNPSTSSSEVTQEGGTYMLLVVHSVHLLIHILYH